MTTYPKSVISDGEIQVTQLRYTFKTPFHLSVLGPERDHAYQWMDTLKNVSHAWVCISVTGHESTGRAL